MNLQIHVILSRDAILTSCYSHSLCGKSLYSEFSWSVFCRIRTEYGEIQSTSPYSVQMQENTGQKNYEYGLFSRSDRYILEVIGDRG